MTLLREIETLAAGHALGVFGAFHPEADEGLPPGTRTLLMFGPREPEFWAHVTSSPEWRDGETDPLDRWSTRVIGAMARTLGGTALFPFGGPPYHPFYAWALRTGRAWTSPVTLLVHDTAGLMLSYRGAIALESTLEIPVARLESPCDGCAEKPCLTACPAGALGAEGYDVPACHAFLDSAAGADCLISGCSVRRACPISRAYGRLPGQSSYHMGLFHR